MVFGFLIICIQLIRFLNWRRYGDGQLKVMFVGGPNQRKDFHIEQGEEVCGVLKAIWLDWIETCVHSLLHSFSSSSRVTLLW